MSRYLGGGPQAWASGLSHQPPLTIRYAKCPPRSDFSATSWGPFAVGQARLEPATNGL